MPPRVVVREQPDARDNERCAGGVRVLRTFAVFRDGGEFIHRLQHPVGTNPAYAARDGADIVLPRRELSADPTFMDEYMSALFLPHTDLDTFPTVRDLLAARGADRRRTP